MTPSSLLVVIVVTVICALVARLLTRKRPAYVGEVVIHGTLTATAMRGDNVTVYHRDTGERPQLVYSINVDEGWILQYVVHKGTRNLVERGGEPVMRRRRGNWGLLPKEPYSRNTPDKRRTYASINAKGQFFTRPQIPDAI